MTSRDDPLTTFGARVMRPFVPGKDSKWEVPFHLSHDHKVSIQYVGKVPTHYGNNYDMAILFKAVVYLMVK